MFMFQLHDFSFLLHENYISFKRYRNIKGCTVVNQAAKDKN